MTTTAAAPTAHVGDGDPCRRCQELYELDEIPGRFVMPLNPTRAMNKMASDGSGYCCTDCGAADTAMRLVTGMDFVMARVAVGNDRWDQLLLPGAPMGLVSQGWMQKSAEGDFDRHLAWLIEWRLWFNDQDGEDDE